MKCILRTVVSVCLVVTLANALFAQSDIYVTGGNSDVNGTYTYQGTFNGKNYYQRFGGNFNQILWQIGGTNYWVIKWGNGQNPYYRNYFDTSLPPAGGWQLDAYGADPVPTLSGGVDPLPVQLSSLSASVANNRVNLHWTTATEINNFGFDIERRAIASSQSTAMNWQKVAFVQAAGTSTSPKEYSFTDKELTAGRYGYRLKQIDKDGSFTYSHAVEAEVGLAAKQFRLAEAYPNPFNPATNIEFSVADPGLVSLVVYDVLGQEVTTLFNGATDVGRLYRVAWDASRVPSGIYFCKLTAGTFTQTRKIVLMR